MFATGTGPAMNVPKKANPGGRSFTNLQYLLAAGITASPYLTPLSPFMNKCAWVYWKYLFVAAFLAGAPCEATAQYQNFAGFDYQSGMLTRLSQIDSIYWLVNDNAAYDPNQHRYFFQGNSSGNPPWNLYTMNALSGQIESTPSAPSNIVGQVFGLQYDPSVDILYCLYSHGGGVYFASIDPGSGIVTQIRYIDNYGGYIQSAFDIAHHGYIVNNGNGLVEIDAKTGLMRYSIPVSTLNNMVFDNTTGRLYGVDNSPFLPIPQFQWIDIPTGVVHEIAELPPVELPQLHAYAVDEKAGKYMFVGKDPPPSACTLNYLYVLDLASGAILSKTLFPYGNGPAKISESLAEFAFDNSIGKLFALNWHPPDGEGITSNIRISTPQNPVCHGAAASFHQITTGSFTNASYEWYLNGIAAGSDTTFTLEKPAAGDQLYCVVTDHSACLTTAPDTSNTIVVAINTGSPTVQIAADATDACSGVPILFTASLRNGSFTPDYIWQVNGTTVDHGPDTLNTKTLADGDVVHAMLSDSQGCGTAITSNEIKVGIRPSPSLYAGNDTAIAFKAPIQLHPALSGNIVSFRWTPGDQLDNTTIADPLFRAFRTSVLTLQVTSDNGCTASGEVKITVQRVLIMPNVFTPNGDGKNDVFRVPPSLGLSIQYFRIYNRWGESVFFTSDAGTGWDGNFHGQPQSGGSYIWEMKYEDPLTRQVVVSKGSVILLR